MGDEIDGAIKKTESSFAEKPFLGRVFCLILVPTHAINIIIKPLVYLVLTIVYFVATIFCTIAYIISIASQHRRQREEVLIHTAINTLNLGVCILVAPVGQFARLIKALAGVFCQKLYFKSSPDKIKSALDQNELSGYISLNVKGFEGTDILKNCLFLDEEAKRLNLPKEDSRSINRLLPSIYRNGPTPGDIKLLDEYIKTLANFFKENPNSPLLPMALQKLNGVDHACIDGIIMKLESALNLLSNKNDLRDKLPHFLEAYKFASIEQMAANLNNIHYVNSIIDLIGEDIDLSDEKIVNARKDGFRRPLRNKMECLNMFKGICTFDGFCDYVLYMLELDKNSLSEIQEAVINAKIESLNDDEINMIKEKLEIPDDEWDWEADKVIYVCQYYYFKDGKLNHQSIVDLASICNKENNPFDFFNHI